MRRPHHGLLLSLFASALVAACNLPAPGPGPDPLLPDLIVQSATLSVTGSVGGHHQVRVEAVVKNVGKAPVTKAKSFQVVPSVRLANPPPGLSPAPGLVSIDSFFQAAFPGQQTTVKGIAFTVTGPLDPGKQRALTAGAILVDAVDGMGLVVVVDSMDKIKESDETNNQHVVSLSGVQIW